MPSRGRGEERAMAIRQGLRRRSSPWFLAVAFIIAALPCAAFIAPATKPPGEGEIRDPYQATAIVTGFDMRSRPTGFARCLREVLVKLSGEPRLQNDPRVSALAAHADTLITSFDYADLMSGVPVHDD